MRTTGEVLARAFHDDPMFAFIEPDPVRRARVLPWFFSAAARLGHQQGRLDEARGRAAAIWLTPGRTALGPVAMVRSGLLTAPVRLGILAFRRFLSITGAFEKAGARAHGEPFWHLFILGVDPDHQGRGEGGRLIAPALALADQGRQETYLETCAERNLACYQRHDFAVAERVDGPGLPKF